MIAAALKEGALRYSKSVLDYCSKFENCWSVFHATPCLFGTANPCILPSTLAECQLSSTLRWLSPAPVNNNNQSPKLHCTTRPRDVYSRFHLPYFKQQVQMLWLLTHSDSQAWCGSSCSPRASCSHRNTAIAGCMHPLGCSPTQLALACRSGSLVIYYMAGLAAPPTGSLPYSDIPSAAITAPQVRICASGKCNEQYCCNTALTAAQQKKRGKGQTQFIVRQQKICDSRLYCKRLV